MHTWNVYLPGISQSVLIERGRLLVLSGHVPLDEAGTLVSRDLGLRLGRCFQRSLEQSIFEETTGSHRLFWISR